MDYCGNFCCEKMEEKLYPIRQHEVAITMACSDSYKNIMGVLLQSIITNADEQENYDIVILEYGISKSDQSRISRFYQRENISVRFYSVREQIEGKDLYVHGYLSDDDLCQIADSANI